LAVVGGAAVFDVVGEKDVGVGDFATVTFGTMPFVDGAEGFLLLLFQIVRYMEGHFEFLLFPPDSTKDYTKCGVFFQIYYRRKCVGGMGNFLEGGLSKNSRDWGSEKGVIWWR
jgi:hypothetical protein